MSNIQGLWLFPWLTGRSTPDFPRIPSEHLSLPAFRDAETNEIIFVLSKSSKERRRVCQQMKQCILSALVRPDEVCWGLGGRGGRHPTRTGVGAGVAS